MKKFEYKEIYINGLYNKGHLEKMQEAGLEGWELVCIVVLSANNNAYAYFKREIQ